MSLAALPEALRPRPVGPAADPAAAVAAITAAAGTSFAAGMGILPRPRREAMWAFYAFARVIDDIADGAFDEADKRGALAEWRAEIDALEAGRPASAIGRALAGPVVRFDLPLGEFRLMIEGMEMDAGAPIQAPPMALLRAYTRRVAGTVGLVSMRIFGAWIGQPSEHFALALADALQFTNIARDVAEDANLDRLYLPAEALARAGLAGLPPATVAADPRVASVRAEIGRLARTEFDRARALIPAHPRRRLLPALMMMGAYEAILNRMARSGFAGTTRPRMGKAAKLAAGLACAALPSWSRGGTWPIERLAGGAGG